MQLLYVKSHLITGCTLKFATNKAVKANLRLDALYFSSLHDSAFMVLLSWQLPLEAVDAHKH